MKKKRLGRTGFNVSELGFGGIPITRLKFDEAVSLVRYCFEQGITFFDTAVGYADSEPKMGEALKDVRSKVILATKTIKRDAERAMLEIEGSLEKLKTDHIDLYQLHNLSRQEELDKVLSKGGAYEAMVKAKDGGKIGSIGFSSHNVDMAVKLCETNLFDTVQVPFNYIEYDPAEKLFSTAQKKDIGIIAMKPLGGGLLDRPDLCFGFLQQYENVIPIPGMESPNEVDVNLMYYKEPKPLKEEDWKAIEKMREELGARFCHRCGYCQLCPNDLEIWRVLLFKSSSKRLPTQSVTEIYKEPMAKAENCDQCGECIEKCPYDLPIPDMIQDSLKYYREFCEQHG